MRTSLRELHVTKHIVQQSPLLSNSYGQRITPTGNPGAFIPDELSSLSYPHALEANLNVVLANMFSYYSMEHLIIPLTTSQQ